mgnify:CR=1 FL=1|tara:strand:+ start:718 stop:999 length:282 start_codon:yes stop_codon:yes gene_type:complete
MTYLDRIDEELLNGNNAAKQFGDFKARQNKCVKVWVARVPRGKAFKRIRAIERSATWMKMRAGMHVLITEVESMCGEVAQLMDSVQELKDVRS